MVVEAGEGASDEGASDSEVVAELGGGAASEVWSCSALELGAGAGAWEVGADDTTLETCDAAAPVACATRVAALKLAPEARVPSWKMSSWAPSWKP